jgi:hypothetical protein
MILDGLLQFTGNARGATATGSVTPSTATNDVMTASGSSSNILDLGLLGIPLSTAAGGNPGGGGARDIGIGDDPAMKILVQVVVAFAGGTSLAINMQGAPDNGSGAPGSFVIMASGPVVVLANLVVGARLFDIDMPRPAPNQPLPRFLQLGYVVVGTMSGGGAVQGYLVLDRHDMPEQSNATLGGYPAGTTVAN